MPLGNNLPLSCLPTMEWTRNVQFMPGVPSLGALGDVHADTILLSWACMAMILGGAAMVAPRLVTNGPGGTGQGILEMLYDFTSGITRDQIGHDWRKFFPLIAAIFIFVLTANFSGILPWEWIADRVPSWPTQEFAERTLQGKPSNNDERAPKPAAAETQSAETQSKEPKKFEVAAPSTDFNVTFGLAVVALLTYLGSGFWAHGGKYLKLYLNPIEWMDLIIRPATLSLRLMMVITADELMRGAAIMMVPVLLPVGVMGFEMFIAVIQAFVFALLTSIYVGLTVSHH